MIVFGLSLHPVKIEADSIPPPKVLTKADLTSLVYQYAKDYGVKSSVMINTINCEDVTWDPEKQSDIIKTGIREESYGLAQINLPNNPEITKSQAQDPNFAIEWMAKQMSNGHAQKWSCYKKIYN